VFFFALDLAFSSSTFRLSDDKNRLSSRPTKNILAKNLRGLANLGQFGTNGFFWKTITPHLWG